LQNIKYDVILKRPINDVVCVGGRNAERECKSSKYQFSPYDSKTT
tara:strand:- start:8573 stop:8707 length:135 start_codon:yes stop_codon:yes gene_type:complete